MTKNKRKTPSREERALRLLKEAVSEAKIKDSSSYIATPAYFARYWVLGPKDRGKKLTEFPRERCSVFKVDYPRDVILVIQVNRAEGISFIENSLLLTAIDLIHGAEKILDAPGSDRLFKIESPRDREEAIDFNVRATLVSYMNYLPVMLDKALDGAYEDSIVRQMRTSIQPALREHWRSIGLPDDFNLLSVWERHSYVKQVEEFRKLFVGKTKPPIPDTLPQIYKELHLSYKRARKHHNDSRKLFLEAPKNNEAAWRKYWDENCRRIFPTLAYSCLMMLADEGHQTNSIMPRELAYRHLSFMCARSPEYMRKQVSNFARTAKDKK